MAGAENSPKTLTVIIIFFNPKICHSWGLTTYGKINCSGDGRLFLKILFLLRSRLGIAELPGRRDYGAMVHHLSKAGGGIF